MRLRIAVAAALAALSLAACSSSTSGKGTLASPPPTGSSQSTPDFTGAPQTPAATDSGASTGSTDPGASEFCARLVDASTKLGDLGAGASDPAALKAEIEKEISIFEGLDASAPPEVKPAIHDLLTVLQAAGKALDNPSAGAATALSDLAKKLPADAQQIAEYVSANCGG